MYSWLGEVGFGDDTRCGDVKATAACIRVVMAGKRAGLWFVEGIGWEIDVARNLEIVIRIFDFLERSDLGEVTGSIRG